MKLLFDNNPRMVTEKQSRYAFVGGQLLTPLTRNRNWGGTFAVDNGCFGRFPQAKFESLLRRNAQHKSKCLFVTMPDVVGAARRTLETFWHWYERLHSWPVALVGQDGIEDFDIPWRVLAAVFIGGSTEWKMSKAAGDLIKAAQIVGVHTHVGRINTVDRWRHFEALGADTCDGSGVSRFDWMLDEIEAARDTGKSLPLFPASGSGSDTECDVRASIPA
jgi:hypothetical protein